MPRRRDLLAAAALPWMASPLRAADAADADVAALLRQGGCVVALRHALAPGTFDPPGFRLGDCSTQRNLNDEGRAQARRIGSWFRERALTPGHVRSSPWCRCIDTATLTFGAAEPWAALGSPRGRADGGGRDALDELRRALAAVTDRGTGFEAWVTHQFVLTDLVGGGVSSGESLVLRADSEGRPRLLARLVA